MGALNLITEKEKFDWLVQEIDNYEDENLVEKNRGPLTNLSSKLILKDVIVTPTYSIGKESLKNFLFINVMHLYSNDNKSKIGWKNIQSAIEGNASRKYNINLEALDKYFDIETNKQAFLEESALLNLRQFKEDDLKQAIEAVEVVKEGLSSGMWLPYLLLRDIQTTARECLGAYHKYYMENKNVYKKDDIEEKEEENEEENDDYDISDNICNERFYKGNEYNIHDKMRTIIFDQYDRLDICDKYNENLVKKERRNGNKDKYYKELQNLHRDCMLAILLHEIFWKATSVNKQAENDLSFMAPLIALYQEFWLGLVTEQFFMIVFESMFLDRVICTEKLKEEKTIKDVTWLAKRNKDMKELKSFSEAFTNSRNRIKAYKDSKECLQEIFEGLKEAEIYGKKLKMESLFQCMKNFLQVVGDKKLLRDKKNLYNLWRIQSVISSWALMQEKEAEKPDWLLKLEEEVKKSSKKEETDR